MSRKSDESVKRPRRTGASMWVPETTDFPLVGAVVGTEGSGMILFVVAAVTVATMVPKRAGLSEVGFLYILLVGSSMNPNHLTAEYPSGGSSSGFRDTVPRRSDFEEYDAGDDETTSRRATSSGANTSTHQTSSTRTSTTKSKAASKAPEPTPAPVVNLLDFDDDNTASSANASVAVNKALPALTPLVSNDNGAPQYQIIEINSCPRTSHTCDSWWR